MSRRKLLFTINRVLLILAVAGILGGLLLDHWDIVRIRALLL